MDPEIRRLGLGGSDIGAIFGVDDFKTAFGVWAEKKGNPEDRIETDSHLEIGHFLEPGMLGAYSFMTNRAATHNAQTFRHPERPYMVYSPDALCDHERRVVEIKIVFPNQRRAWDEDMPMRVALQCYWYMAALDYDWCDVCALVAGWPRVYELPRDLAAERVMLQRVKEWWERYIVGDDVPEMGNSPEAARWLQHVYPVQKFDVREGTQEEQNTLRQYLITRLAQNKLDDRRDQLETLIKAAIADSAGLTFDGGNGLFTWKRSKDGKKTDWKSMAYGLLHHFVKDNDERARLLAEYSHVKPGTRRIYFRHPSLKEADELLEVA